MTGFRFVNGRVVTPAGILDGAAIAVADGHIASVAPLSVADAAAAETVDLEGGWLVPGFIDTQVNGGGGVLFNDEPTVEGIATIGRAHARYGTTGFMATLISDVPAVIGRALDAADEAFAAGVPGFLGVHVEGPIISVTRKGIHDAGKFRRLDPEMLALFEKPRRGKVMLTLAPELVPLDDITRLRELGVILAIGHSDADYDTATAAFAAGMTGVTHLYNAMSPLVHRSPGVVGASLDNQTAYCGLIVDGFHAHDAAFRIALRARPLDRFMLVTDAMSCVGVDVTEFDLHGRRILVRDGRCVGEDGTLAGAAIDMTAAFRNTINRLGRSPAEAAIMASSAPAAFLGLSHQRGTLSPGLAADWVRLTADFHPAGTWIAGTRIA